MSRTGPKRSRVTQSIGGALSLAMLFGVTVAGAADIVVTSATGQQLLADSTNLTVKTGGSVAATGTDVDVTAVLSGILDTSDPPVMVPNPTGISRNEGFETYGITNGTVTVNAGGSIIAEAIGTYDELIDDIYARAIEAEDGTTITNAGTITATVKAVTDYYYTAHAFAVQVHAGDAVSGSIVVNNQAGGTISASATNTGEATATAIKLPGNGATYYPSYIPAGEGTPVADVRVTNAGTLLAEASSVESDASASAIETGGHIEGLAIVNSGDILANAVSSGYDANARGIHTGGYINDLTIINSGDIVAEAEGYYSGNARAIHIGDNIGGGFTIDNSGLLSATAVGKDDDANARGIQVGGYDFTWDSEAEEYVYEIDDPATLKITNSGQINASAAADRTDYYANARGIQIGESFAGLSIDNAAGGEIVAEASGYNASATGIHTGGDITGLAISNAGMIQADATATWDTASAIGIKAENGNNTVVGEEEVNGTITNSGTIDVTATNLAVDYSFGSGEGYGSAAEATGIKVGQSKYYDTDGFIDVTNAAGATISATAIAEFGGDAVAKGIHAGDDTVDLITNAGTIEAFAQGGEDTNAFGVQAGGGMTMENSGTIKAEVDVKYNYSVYNSNAVGIFAADINGTEDDVAITNKAGATIAVTSNHVGYSYVGSAGAIGIKLSDGYVYGFSGEDTTLTRTVINAGTIAAISTIDALDGLDNNSGAIGIKAGYTQAYNYTADSVLTSELDITNAGTITANATITSGYDIDDNPGAFGIRVGETYAYAYDSANAAAVATTTITNKGTIIADSNLTSTDYLGDNAGAFGIRAGQVDAYGYGPATATLDITNEGTIQVTTVLNSDYDLGDNSGSFGIRTGNVNAYSYDEVNQSVGTITVTNKGTIVSTATLTAPEMEYSDGAFGIKVGDGENFEVGGDYDVNVINSGTITANLTMTTDYMDDTIYNRGAFGIRTGAAKVVNTGTITANATMNGLNDSYYDGAVGIRTGEGYATVVNTGTITANLVDTDSSTMQRAVGIMMGQEGNELHLSGSVAATATGGDAFSVVLGCNPNEIIPDGEPAALDTNALMVMNGASMSGDALNASDYTTATAMFGLQQKDDGMADFGPDYANAAELITALDSVVDAAGFNAAVANVPVDPAFNFKFNNDFLGENAGWDAIMFGGTTTINNSLDSWIEGAYVGPQATFAGNAFVGDLRVMGTVAPGDGGIGVMDVAGEFEQSAGSTYLAEVGTNGAADLIKVAGPALIATAGEGETAPALKVSAAGYVPDGGVYKVLDATAMGLTGTYAEVDNQDSVVLDYALVADTDLVNYEANTVKLVADRTPYQELGIGGNALAAADALADAAVGGNDAAGEYLAGADNCTTASCVESALNAAAPAHYPNLIDASMAGARLYRSSVVGRMGNLHLTNTAKSIQYASNTITPNGPALSRLPGMERESGSWSAWGKVLGMTADQDKGNDVAGFDIDTIGVSLGFDNQISTNFALGLGFGINNSDIEFDDGQDTDMDSYNVGLYGTYSTTAFYVDGGLFFAGNDYDSERGTTTSTTDGTEYGAYLGAGYNLVDNKSWYFIPTASVEWAQVDIDGFTEEGGPLNWQIKDYDSSSLVGTLGFRIGSKMTMGRAKVEPEFRLAWAHEFGDTERTSKARLAVGGTSFYSFDGIEAEEDSALFGVGINTYFTENFSLGIDYDGEYNESFQGHSIAAMLRYKF